MAKKNSTKTATKEALQASEPRLQQFSQWKGINFSFAPHSWSDSPYDAHDPSTWPDGDHHNQSDLPANYFMVQNNIRIEDNGSVETRNETLTTISADQDQLLTGVNHVASDKLFFALEDGSIKWINIGSEIIFANRTNAFFNTDKISSGNSGSIFINSLDNVFSQESNAAYALSIFPNEDICVLDELGLTETTVYKDYLNREVTEESYLDIEIAFRNQAAHNAVVDPFSPAGHPPTIIADNRKAIVFPPDSDHSIKTSSYDNLGNLVTPNGRIIFESDVFANLSNADFSVYAVSKLDNELLKNGIINIRGRAVRGSMFFPGAFYAGNTAFNFLGFQRPDDITNLQTYDYWIEPAEDNRNPFYMTCIKIGDGPFATSADARSALRTDVTGDQTKQKWVNSGIYVKNIDGDSRPLYNILLDSSPFFSSSPSIKLGGEDFTFSIYSISANVSGTLKFTFEYKINQQLHTVLVEKAPDRDTTKPIIWDSINDVLGDLICFGHYVDDNGNNIYNIYRQIPLEDDDPEDAIRIKAYAAIPDPNKELEVGFNPNGSQYVWYPMSDIRIGFMNIPVDRAMDYKQSISTSTNDYLGGWNDTFIDNDPSRKPTGFYQYFRSTKDIDIYGDDVWGTNNAGRPIVGSGNLGTRFETPVAGNMSGRICVSLPYTQIYGDDSTAQKYFQQSPMAIWEWTGTAENGYYRPINYPAGNQFIRCFEADGETPVPYKINVGTESEPNWQVNPAFPGHCMFPIVTSSKTTTYFSSRTLRCVDPVDATAMNDVEDSNTARVFHKSGAEYLNNEVYPFRYSFCYVYTNPLGHTIASQWRTVYANLAAEDLSTATGAFRITQWVPENDELHDYDSITGVDIFYTKDDYKTMAFAGHVDFPEGGVTNLVGRQWIYDWYGGSSDTTEWSNAGLTLPDENTTRGPECEWMDYIDNKCYFYGGARKYRLYIGGRVGHELCTTASVGGGWLDINPGSGVELKKVLKFKTYNGANIVTILASHANHRYVRRYNLIQNNIAITNELTRQGYSFEEVSNVVGAISHWGAGVWAEGLYTLSRYGLCLTTQQMENTNNLRAQVVSEPISPIFTEGIAENMHRSEMIFSDDKVYFVLSTHDLRGEVSDPAEIIFCYDVNAKGWYTYTLDGETNILSVFNFDYEGNKEGIGVITPTKIYLIPNAGIEDNAWPTPANKDNFVFHTDRSILETGELALRTPPSTYQTLSQLEFRFDYFIGDVTIDVTGVDYYGRHFNVQKEVHEHDLVTEYPVYVRVDRLLQTYNVRIEGYAHYRLTHILTKTYPESNKIDLVYGFDSDNRYEARQKYCYIDGVKTEIQTLPDRQYGGTEHHYIRNYNNLRECIVP